MNDQFRLNGRWWVPQYPGLIIPGEITFDPIRGIILDLNGLLKEDEACAMPFDIVLGMSADGLPITVIGSNDGWFDRGYRVIHKGGADEPICSVIFADLLIIGGHYRRPEEIHLERLTFELSNISYTAISALVGNDSNG